MLRRFIIVLKKKDFGYNNLSLKGNLLKYCVERFKFKHAVYNLESMQINASKTLVCKNIKQKFTFCLVQKLIICFLVNDNLLIKHFHYSLTEF